MILLFTSDLQGRVGHYRALREAIASVQPDVLVLGGNLFPDNPANDLARMGTHQPVYVLEVFRTWLGAVHNQRAGLPVLTICGNRDWLSTARALEELSQQSPHLKCLGHEQAVEIGGLSFLGYSRTPPTPGFVKDFERLDEPGDEPPAMGGARWDPGRRKVLTGPARQQFTQFPSMAEELERMARPAGPWVLVAHAPPHDTPLDRDFHGEPRGSRAIRRVIEQHRPLLSLHGHVCESPDITGQHEVRLGETTAVNVGQHVEGLYYGVIEVDVPARRVVRVERRVRPRSDPRERPQ